MKNTKKHFFLFTILLFSVWCEQNANAQQLIKGRIIDAKTQEPIAFANVGVIGKAQGTTAEENGYFEISISKTKTTKLVVSHINYYKQDVTINSSSKLNIALQPKDLQLEEVVVSEALYEKPLNKLTRQASVISNRDIQEEAHSNIIDVVASTPGITQVWEYHSPVILRGLNSNRIIIMKDGNRRIGTFPGGYFGQDMNIYDTKKIEIVKGPGSVIYGSGAISGIINVISNEPFGNRDLKTTILSAYGSNNQELLEMAKVCYKNEKFGISANGKYRKTDDYIYGNGETAENTAVEDHDFTINTGYRFSEEHQLVLNGSYHYGDWGKPIGFNNNKNTKINNLEESVHSDVSYTYAPNKLVESVHFNLFYDQGTRDYYKYVYNAISGDPSTLTLVHYKNNYGGAHIYSILNLNEKNKLTLGADGYLFHLDDPSEYYDYNDDTHYTTENYNNAGQQNGGIFVNDEWIASEKLRFVAGVRWDDYKVFEGSGSNDDEVQREAVSGNFGFVFSPTVHTNFSFNVGRAFRMPTSSELFATVVSCAGTKKGNPTLNPEYGWNFDLGMRGKTLNQKLKYDVALFYIQLKD
jgi:iron complex outermembrane receptor protein